MQIKESEIINTLIEESIRSLNNLMSNSQNLNHPKWLNMTSIWKNSNTEPQFLKLSNLNKMMLLQHSLKNLFKEMNYNLQFLILQKKNSKLYSNLLLKKSQTLNSLQSVYKYFIKLSLHMTVLIWNYMKLSRKFLMMRFKSKKN